MKQSNQAIRPSFVDYRKVVEKAEPVKDPDLVEERQLAALSRQEGWKVLQQYIKEKREGLSDINKSMMERGASFDDIGKNAVIVQLANELLEGIVQKVEDAAEAVNKADEGK